jgi:hypothetical protein
MLVAADVAHAPTVGDNVAGEIPVIAGCAREEFGAAGVDAVDGGVGALQSTGGKSRPIFCENNGYTVKMMDTMRLDLLGPLLESLTGKR